MGKSNVFEKYKRFGGATGRRLACDFGVVIFQSENRKIPQASGLRYTKKVINLVPLREAPT